MKRCLGSELKEGDIIEVWWKPRSATIHKLTPYHNPGLSPGAQIAVLHSAGDVRSMTIEAGMLYTVRGNTCTY